MAARVINPSTGEEEEVYALVDTGANRDYMSTELANRLKMEVKYSTLNLKTATDSSIGIRPMADVILESLDGEYRATVEDVLIGDFPCKDSSMAPGKKDWSAYEHLRGIEFADIDAEVELIISSGHTEATVWTEIIKPDRRKEEEEDEEEEEPGKKGKRRRRTRKEPVATKNVFGWTLQGPDGKKGDSQVSISLLSAEDKMLRDQLQSLFDRDFPPTVDHVHNLSREAKYALEQLEESVKWNEEKGKYSAGLPYKYGREKTAEILNNVNSRATAERRAWSLKRSMEKIPDKKTKGFSEMTKFINEGRTRVLEEEEKSIQEESGNPIWHLPCHLVFQKGKYRFCHDGRANTKGICLNDFLIGDLNLMVPILDPINNMRSYLYAFSTDIKGFFHNILVDEKDQGAFRYYWYKDESMEELVMYVFLAFIFGSSASPTVSSFILKRHSRIMRSIFSERVCDIIEKFFYVDDGSSGDNSIEGCKMLCDELEKAMKLGGFDLDKWKFSHRELEGERKVDGETAEKKLLGVVWNTDTDRLSVAIEDEKFEKRAETPRHVVQQQAALFDPIGMIAPFILLGRKWTQSSMVDEWSWDTRLLAAVEEGFNKWTASIHLLKKLSIPRAWDSPETVGGKEQIHIFSDACLTGFGTVAYRRVIGETGVIRVVFMKGNSHVTPKNASKAGFHGSIPRLELSAAVKATEVLKALQHSVQGRFKDIWMWSDSTCVLNQIKDRSRNYKTYVANRLSKIHKVTKDEHWHYCDSERNPADLSSRGIKAHESEKWEFYHNGPQFLWMNQEDWPSMKLAPPDEAVIKTTVVDEEIIIPTEEEESWLWKWEFVSNISGWEKKKHRLWSLKKCVRWWRIKSKFRCKCKRRCRCDALKQRKIRLEQVDNEKWQEMQQMDAEIKISIQVKHFLSERRDIQRKGIKGPNSRKEMVKKGSPLNPHNPFMDEDGLIRVGSRLIYSDLTEEAKCPVILPKNDTNVTDLIRETHKQDMHSGAKQVLCTLRQSVWILQGLQAVKKVITNCVHCQRIKKKVCEQKMAPLPRERTTTTAPFYHCGIDIMGHFLVKLNGRANHKVYVAVFSCFETRAVHAEIVFKLDADSAINAITRFNARRPGMNKMYSDRGTNFIASNAILTKELEIINKEAAPSLARKGITWQFNPPHAPHRGGTWERVVGLFKKTLSGISKGDVLHYDTFATAVVEAEGILNKRPLTHISTDSRDMEALTPNHLLAPSTIHLRQQPEVRAAKDVAEGLRNSWRRAQSRVDAFWRDFKRDYLSLLHSRSKWRRTHDNLKINDLVILAEDCKDRNQWKMGRVVGTTNSDGHVRKAEIMRPDGKVVQRDRVKIIKMELDE